MLIELVETLGGLDQTDQLILDLMILERIALYFVLAEISSQSASTARVSMI